MELPTPLRALFAVLSPRATLAANFTAVVDYYETLSLNARKRLFLLFVISVVMTGTLPQSGPFAVLGTLVWMLQLAYIAGFIVRLFRRKKEMRAVLENAHTERTSETPEETTQRYAEALRSLQKTLTRRPATTPRPTDPTPPPRTERPALTQPNVIKTRKRQDDVVVRRR